MWRVSETADERRGQQSELGAGDPVLAVYYVGGSEEGEREEERLPVSCSRVSLLKRYAATPLWKWTSDSGVALLGLENM